VFLFVSSLLVFWSLRGCSRVWLLLDLKVTLPCCCLCVLSIPSLSLLQPLAKCPSIETWEIPLLTAVLPLLVGGTTAPRYYRPPARYYRSIEGDVIPKGYGDLLPYPFSFFSPSPHSSRAPSQHPPRSAASVPSFEVLLRWDQSPPSSCAMDPGIASFLPRFGSTFLSLAVRAIRVDPLGFWLFLGTLRTWKDC